MGKATLDQLLDLLEVRVDAFAMCEIEKHCALRCAPLDSILVHFVLKGEGSIECDQGSFPLRPGTIVVVPRAFPKTIAGSGKTLRVMDAANDCPLVDGMVKFRACEGEADLILGCALVSASVGEMFDLFEHLEQPLLEQASGGPLAPVLEAMLAELANPKMGTRAIVGALMKHVLIVVLRSHLSRLDLGSSLSMPFMDPHLGKVVTSILSRPQDSHSVAELAALAGMSRSRFTEHFTATYGRSPIDFVQSVRLGTARRMLGRSELPIKAIAASVGYASRSHFSRAFRAAFGVDPTSYRDGAESVAALEQMEPPKILPPSGAAVG